MIDERLIEAIKEDADLLTQTDQWLEEEKNHYTSQLEATISELKPILLAILIKRQLQQKNMVPALKLQRDENGNVSDVIVEICKLQEAVKCITHKDIDIYDRLIAAGNLATWHNDGYDIETCLQADI